MDKKEWLNIKYELLQLIKYEPLDKGVIDIINAFNKFPDIATCESCEGHGNHPLFYVSFITLDMNFKYEMVLMETIKKSAEENNICLGCLRVELAKTNHYDCAHKLQRYWNLTIEPRTDYGKGAKSDINIIKNSIVEKLKELK